MNRIMTVVGTRPETIKMAPVIRALLNKKKKFTFVHSGQHYDYNLSKMFIEELELPKPDYSFQIKTYSPSEQTARIILSLSEVVHKEKPKLILIQGDTNTMFAAAISGFKSNVPVGHIEAGLRSNDWRMQEEHNRRMVDHASSYLFAPTETARKNLRSERVWGKIFVTGNTVIDAIRQHIDIAEKKSMILNRIKFKEYALATVHRQENVDNKNVLKNITEAFMRSDIPILFPTHPRTLNKLREFKWLRKLEKSKNIQLLPSLGYFDFLILMKNCNLILTDSGGIQEEATAPSIRKHVLVLRISTERPEAVEAGFAKIIGIKKEEILKNIDSVLNQEGKRLPGTSPFGNGYATDKIINIMENQRIY